MSQNTEFEILSIVLSCPRLRKVCKGARKKIRKEKLKKANTSVAFDVSSTKRDVKVAHMNSLNTKTTAGPNFFKSSTMFIDNSLRHGSARHNSTLYVTGGNRNTIHGARKPSVHVSQRSNSTLQVDNNLRKPSRLEDLGETMQNDFLRSSVAPRSSRLSGIAELNSALFVGDKKEEVKVEAKVDFGRLKVLKTATTVQF